MFSANTDQLPQSNPSHYKLCPQVLHPALPHTTRYTELPVYYPQGSVRVQVLGLSHGNIQEQSLSANAKYIHKTGSKGGLRKQGFVEDCKIEID